MASAPDDTAPTEGSTTLSELSPALRELVRYGDGERIPGTRATFRALVEHLPAVAYIADDDEASTPLWVSPQVEQLLGFTPEEMVSGERPWRRQLHPEDRERVLREDARTSLTGEPWQAEYRIFSKDGRSVWLRDEAALVEAADGTRFWQGVWLDVTEQKLAEEAVRRRDSILEAVGYAAKRFLRVDSWETCANEVLAHLGEATGVSRVYVFENRHDPVGQVLMDLTFEWCAPGIESTMHDPTNHGWPYLPDYARWLEYFREGRALYGKRSEFPPVEQLDLDDEQILSTAFLPIFVDGKWWGYLGFDDCRTEREWLPSEIEVLYAAAGILGGAIGARRAREELERAHARFQGFMEQIPAMLYIDPVAEEEPAIFVSSHSEQILGVTPDEYAADVFWWERHLHPDDRALALEEYERLLASGEASVMDYRIVRPDGSVVWIHDRVRLLRDDQGEPLMLQGVIFDNTDRKRAEHALHDALARETEATARLRELDELKTAFLHAVSHDLRTPLAAILGISMTLERPELRLPVEQVSELNGRIGANARKLDRLLEDLLDLDRLDRGIVEPRRTPTDVTALVERVVHESDARARRTVVVEAEPIVSSLDASKSERIVENLLHNAVKYTPPGSSIWIRLARGPEGGVTLVVEDDGPGVVEEDRERIFQAFTRGAEAGNAPGTGVGLSLVAKFAGLHGGKAWVQEREGGGASFRVWLPAAPQEALNQIA